MGKEKNPKEEEFKVIDKRYSAGGVDEPEKEKGDTFTMKDVENPTLEPGKIDFSTLAFSLATGALINMGIAPDPVTKKATKNLELARQNVDILAMLQEKTKGNLTAEEVKLIESLLTEVRLRFVEASREPGL